MNSLSTKPELLARRWPNPYVYGSAWKRVMARLFDGLGYLALPSPSLTPPWSQIKRLAVLRLDHLGDVLNAFPMLAELRRTLPGARIDLWVGEHGRAMAQLCPSVDSVHVVDAPWFNRPLRQAWPLRAIFRIGRQLKDQNYDMVIEPRGEARHHLAAFLSRAPWRLGLAQTAGGFLLTHAAAFRAGLHEQDQNFEALAVHGFPGLRQAGALILKPGPQARGQAASLMRRLRVKPGFVAVQAACGTSAKRWMPQRWAELIDRLAPRKVVLLGSKSEVAEMQALAKLCKKKPVLATGMLNLEGLAAFLIQARVLFSVDSMPGHLAAAVETPLIALYSGTNRARQWAPRGKKVILIQVRPSCSPCELTDCPFANECMRRIEVDEVLEVAKRWL